MLKNEEARISGQTINRLLNDLGSASNLVVGVRQGGTPCNYPQPGVKGD